MKEYTVQVDANGDKSWTRRGELHCEHGPAIEWADGSKAWYLNGERHREDGPAIERANGYKAWYLEGKELTKEEWKNILKCPRCGGCRT